MILTEPEWLDMAMDLAAATGKHALVVAEPAYSDLPLRAAGDPDAVAFLMHTSGTTGLPKKVLAREAALARRAEVNGELLQLESGSGSVTPASSTTSPRSATSRSVSRTAPPW